MEQLNLEDKLEQRKLFKFHSDRLGKEIRRAKFQHALKHQKRYYFEKLLILIALISFIYINSGSSYKVVTKEAKIAADTIVYKVPPQDSTKSRKAFLMKMKQMESNGKLSIVNSYGYMGYYQMGRSALKAIGMEGISNEDFLSIPELQEAAMILLLKKNKEILEPYIVRYNGKFVGDIYITESGILAAAHGWGAGGVIKYLTTQGDSVAVDANGVELTSRLKIFSGYKLNL